MGSNVSAPPINDILKSGMLERDHLLKRFAIIGVTFLLTATLLVYASVHQTAEATDYRSQQGVKKHNYALAAAKGTILIEAVPYSSGGWSNHKDIMVYINLNNGQSIGAGYVAYYDSGASEVKMYDLIYFYKPTVGASHTLTSTVAVYDQWTARVEQTSSSSSNSWKAVTKTASQTISFSQTTTPAAPAGNTARTFSSYVQNTNDMPAKFDNLMTGRWISGAINYDQYFSQNINEYKCFSQHGYVLDELTGIDKTGHGPRIYTTDDCTQNSAGWDAYGE